MSVKKCCSKTFTQIWWKTHKKVNVSLTGNFGGGWTCLCSKQWRLKANINKVTKYQCLVTKKTKHPKPLYSLPMWQIIEKGIGIFFRKGPFGYLVLLWHKQKFKTNICFTNTLFDQKSPALLVLVVNRGEIIQLYTYGHVNALTELSKGPIQWKGGGGHLN